MTTKTLIERLQSQAAVQILQGKTENQILHGDLLADAAQRISKLEAALEKVCVSLKDITDEMECGDIVGASSAWYQCACIALREAAEVRT